MDDYCNLGKYCREVSSPSAKARTWFNRGLVWCYSFHQAAALQCFHECVRHDEQCAMGYWGIAYARGPYYNKQWHKFDPLDLAETVAATYAASRKAFELADGVSDVEAALIQALLQRYPASQPEDDMLAWTDAYADAMREVYRSYGQDTDVAALFAEAMMNRTPWALWDLHTGEPQAGADTLETLAVLEQALEQREAAGEQDHPGLLHLYIHLLEMSPHPEKALPAADRLRDLVPDAGHLRHMPTHIDAQCGDYQAVVSSNDHALAADHRWLARGGELGFFALSIAHNHHFKLYGAMFLGQYKAAREAADGLRNDLPETLLRVSSPPMADWLEGYVAMQVHARIRFGKWRELLAEPLPDDPELYCTTTAMQHYARGLAHAVLRDVGAADLERERFVAAVTRVPATRTVFNNTCLDILAIARCMLDGEIEYRRGNHEPAFAHLREAVQLADDMPYDEPWGWMQPARHALGALLLEQGRVEEAEAVYRDDLGLNPTLIRACQHPDNVWSLHGLHECLRRQGKDAQAALIAPRLNLALARADVPIRASCLCRLDCAPTGAIGGP